MSEDNGIRKPELDACLSMGELRILARLGQLAATMASIEVVFCNTPSPPNDPGYAERAAAREALKAVMKFCWDVRIERSPLSRLQDALVGVGEGHQPAAMLCPPRVNHRRGDRPAVQANKAMLAAVMKAQQERGGLSREEAAKWVAANTPRDLQQKISKKPITPRAVKNWDETYGGEHGDPGYARDRYLEVLDAVRNLDKAEPKRLLNKRLLNMMAKMSDLTALGTPETT